MLVCKEAKVAADVDIDPMLLVAIAEQRSAYKRGGGDRCAPGTRRDARSDRHR